MRLLHTATITLTSFEGDDDIPPYAILSHTWGQDEVSFHDLLTKASSELDSQAGYSKIRSCCALAAQEGFEYVWIDTCCIDKTSSAELSEAINSMFRWYQKAHVCYAYLADVRIFDSGPWSPDGGREFRESRWFTRGWTLQELLAPRRVVFYGRDWQEFGSKESLKAQISLITAIRQDHIFNINRASVAQKMSWASQRRTTRVEDIAYSLMGIFDVNMPLLYGEGKKAFTRLQHEIVKITDDESLFAWMDDRLVESGMFARSPKAFARSGNIVQIIDGQPLYVRRTPYTVTNRGLAIEIFASKDKAFVTDEGFAFVPLNCARWWDSSSAPSHNLAIKLDHISPDNFVRSSPQELDSPNLSIDKSSSRLVYIHPFYVACDPHELQHSFIIDTSSIIKRGNPFTKLYGLQTQQLRRGGPYARLRRVTIGERKKFVALGWRCHHMDAWREYGLILSAYNGDVGINVILLSKDQNFGKEMGEYENRQRYISSTSIPTQISTQIHDYFSVTVSLKSEEVAPGTVMKRHFVKIQFIDYTTTDIHF